MTHSRSTYLALALIALIPVVGSAQDLFERRRSWSSVLRETTAGVALGDVDRDGDLDLLCANLGDQSCLYLNEGKRLSRSRAWVTASWDSSRAVAVGDVNHDRHLDVVFAGPDGIRLFLGDGRTFEDQPSWTVRDVEVHGIALGDVDRDGDLDLVCANEHASTLYRNTNGMLEVVPAWVSPGARNSSVALGDVDGDGALDLVLGRRIDRNALFLNVDGTFGSTPTWEAAALEVTTGVALGDIDRDGKLDLVCANDGTPSVSYRNIGGTFDREPAWRSALTRSLSSVALGDVDLDGDLDAAFGHFTGGFNPQGGSYVFLTQNDSLQTIPSWESEAETFTRGIALADVNNDGDLDFVCGNGDDANFVYDGLQTLFPRPSWGVNENASDFALGDVDTDGDLDLVVGNLDSRGDAFYRNDDGRLGSDPVWRSNLKVGTRSVALGDVDGDGDLDLVCGSEALPNTLWHFDRDTGTFRDAPAWESDRTQHTWSVALGDFDADGDLDLLCGNDGQSHILRNAGGVFEAEPMWTAGVAVAFPSVAVGDVDHDGWLDFVIASPTGTHLFRNDRGRFPDRPSWSLEFPETTRDIALGDMDGDGDLDLVCGNELDPSTLYRNIGGFFESTSAWLPEQSILTAGIALGDVDADGDLDVFSASYQEQSGLFLNSSAGLAQEPVWVGSFATAVACGDLDRDGDLDVLLAEQLGSPVLYDGHRSPAGGFDPLQAGARLPNEPAQLRGVRVTSSGGNSQNIAFRAYDAEADSLWILAEFQAKGSSIWTPVSQPGIVPPTPGLAIGPFAATRAGVDNNIVWDLSTLLYGRFDLALRLRAVSEPQHAGFVQFIPSHLTDVGTVVVRRPFLGFTGLDTNDRLVLPVVTVGDTVVATFGIDNLGNDTLRVNSITPPFEGQLRLDNMRPFEVPPGGSRSIRAEYTPFESPTGPGFIQVSSNDPNRPNFLFDVIAPTLELRVRTQVLSIEDTVRLAQALTIQALPETNVFVEQAKLFHRFRGSGAEFSSIPMQLLPGETALDGPRLANLGADMVTEVGLEYYVLLENSDIVATDPPGAPDQGVYEIDVQPPESFTVTPIANSTVGYLAERPIDLVVEVPSGAGFVDGRLFWRRGGTMNWFQEPVTRFEFDAFATIPDSGVGERGVEFYVTMQTQTSHLESPPAGAASPSQLQVRVPNLKESTTHSGGRYRMFSIPLDVDARDLFVDELLADGEGFGPYDPTLWRVFRYDPDALANLELTYDRLDLFEPKPGAAFWLISRSEHRLDTAPVEGASTSTGSGMRIPLKKGWNQFGNPFAFPVAWSSVETSVPLAPPVAFDPNLGANGGYVDEPVTVLRPFAGYFIENPTNADQELVVPPLEAGAVVQRVGAAAPHAGALAPRDAAPPPEEAPPPHDAAHWWVRLVASSGDAIDAANRFGVDPRAADTRDDRDAPEPPPAPGDWVQLGFVLEAGRLRHDLRAPAEGHAWDIEVRTSARGAEVRLAPTLVSPLPADLVLRLLDLEQGTTVTLGAEDYSLIAYGSERPYRLRILAGSAAWVERAAAEQLALPASFSFDRAVPNPFRGATRFRFGIPQAAPVALEIYDVRGGRVAALVNGETLPAGYHVRLWNGEDTAGRRVANGIYFAHLRAGDRTATWRITVLR